MEQSNAEDFSTILRSLIESTGLSICGISRITKISYKAMYNYCNRRCLPDVDQLIKLADYFAVPLDYLIGRCSAEEAQTIAANYPAHFMELRRAPYEYYLVGRNAQFSNVASKGESPWPYNLMDDVFKIQWPDELTEDQIAGIEAAISSLTDREKESVQLYYRDGFTLDKIGDKHKVTREREHQIIAKAVRKLRAPHRKNLMMHGVKGAEERSYLAQRKYELEKEAAKLRAYEKQLAEKKAQLCDSAMAMSDSDIPSSSFGMKLFDMDLSVRSYNVLYRYGCKTLGDVINVVESGNLMHVRNLGRKSAEEILEKIYCLTGKRYPLA